MGNIQHNILGWGSSLAGLTEASIIFFICAEKRIEQASFIAMDYYDLILTLLPKF